MTNKQGTEKCNKCDGTGSYYQYTKIDDVNHLIQMNCDHSPQGDTPDWEKEFIESGADIEHDRWARWQKYFFSKCHIKPQSEVNGMDDRYVYFALSKDLYERWNRQIITPYNELSEQEKESDRKETRNYLPFIHNLILQAREEVREEMKDVIRKAELYDQQCEAVKELDVEKSKRRPYFG